MFKGQIVFLQGWWCVPAGWGRTKHPWLSPIAIELRGITCWNLCEMSMHIYIYIYYNIYIYYMSDKMSEHLICQIDYQNPFQACQIQSRNICQLGWYGRSARSPGSHELLEIQIWEKQEPLDSAGWLDGWGIPQSHPIPSNPIVSSFSPRFGVSPSWTKKKSLRRARIVAPAE